MISRIDILNHAELLGIQQAYNLLILAGPDGYLGGYEDYKDIEETLEEAARATGINLE